MKKLFSPIFLGYLRVISKIELWKIHPKIVGVAGSSGKTSTAYLIDLILKERYKVRSSEGKNSETGIPLTILGLDAKTYKISDWILIGIKSLLKVFLVFQKFDVLVAEMGIDGPKEPKNMSYLLKIIKPDISILTNVSLEHSVYFDEMVGDEDLTLRKKKILELIKEDETKILRNINKNSFAIINLDDENISGLVSKIKANKITISSKSDDTDYKIESYEVSLKNTEIHFSNRGEDHVLKINGPLPYFYSYSIIFAIACANILEISIKDSIEILESKFSLPAGRLSIFNGIKNTTIIDSTYNNSIEAISGLLDLVNKISDKRRKVGIIGDIREQGKQSELLHRELGKKINETLDFAILIGEQNSKFTASELGKNGFNFKSFMAFNDAKGEILNSVKEGDLILIKGSQNQIMLERAVELLLENKNDISRLTRRGKFWDEKRSKTP